MTRHRVEAVVFDVDGTLLKSIEQHAEAYRVALAPLGIKVEPMQVFLMEGARSESIVDQFLRETGRVPARAEVAALAAAKQRVYEELGTPVPYPGAFAVVREVRRRGFRTGLVTGTKRRNVDRLLGEIMDCIDVVRAQEDYTKDKPDPEPYLSATEALGVHPRHCVVLENAPRGIESAKRAGMRVAALTTTLARAYVEPHADWVLPDHAALLDILPRRPGGLADSGTAK